MKSYFKKKITNIIIICRDKEVLSESTHITSWLKDRNVRSKVFLQNKINKKILKTNAHFILVLGGDGTYLQAVHYSHNQTIPILGVNMGSLGFLTVHTRKKIYFYLEKTLKGQMEVIERNLLKVTVKKSSGQELSCLALNDIVIERGVGSKLINIAVYLKTQFIYSIKADGLIIASATGSTAYNLAAGGPILQPKVKAFVVTPICPHMLTHRPVIFSDNQVLKFYLETPSKGAYLTVDGRKFVGLSKSSCVIIKKAQQCHKALRDPNYSEFIFLKDKLNFFERPV